MCALECDPCALEVVVLIEADDGQELVGLGQLIVQRERPSHGVPRALAHRCIGAQQEVGLGERGPRRGETRIEGDDVLELSPRSTRVACGELLPAAQELFIDRGGRGPGHAAGVRRDLER